MLANGAACENDVQCMSGSCVKDPGESGPCGLCTARAGLDESCINNVKCDWDLVCASTTCQPPVPKDGACVKGQCIGPYRCIGGICKDPVQLDGACEDDAADDDWCDETKLLDCKRTVPGNTEGTCKAFATAAVGQPCGFVNENIVFCPPGASCAGSVGSTTCQTKAADGASCDAELGPDCNEPAECIDGTCTLPPADRCK